MELEEIIKKLEIKEKQIKNRTIWWTVLIPLISVLVTIPVTIYTTGMTVKKEFELDKMNFVQEQINQILKEDDLVKSRKKLQFLLDSELFGKEFNDSKLVESLEKNFINESDGTKSFMEGILIFNDALNAEDDITKADKYNTAINYFNESLEYNPNMHEARVHMGYCFYNLGYIFEKYTFYEKALKQLTIALKKDTTLIQLHLDKIDIFEELGDADGIREELTYIKDNDIIFPWEALEDSQQLVVNKYHLKYIDTSLE
ncbi:tetratricopeptide repeat protein [Aquimarina litoralis]|uniref:tetratricopeptide repeat protein n=1 Tax=Aquimarina litoralis TaxID=584605 RepID=UPI001C575231|nr:hypothetical protein [Aquimarina litoralis]MBW1298592.1 hypothetical protein [Aquimarina litoralis]